MTWQPMTDQHAIERVRIVLVLDEIVPPKKARSLAAGLEGRRDELGFEPMAVPAGQQFAIQMGPAGAQLVAQPPEGAGWTFQRLSAEGGTVEAFRLSQNTLLYEAAEYARWPIFLERFLDVAGAVFRDLLDSHEITSLALEYYDRFRFEGPSKAALPSQFLTALQGKMPTSVTEGGELWHFYRGWFEPGQHGRLLVAQNLDAVDEAIPAEEGEEPKTQRVIKVMTRAEARKGFWTIADEDLQPHLEIMHERTNQVFAESLTEDMQRRVGISKGA